MELRRRLWIIAGIIIFLLLTAIALVPFAIPALTQPQTQYLAGVMVLTAGILAFWGTQLTRSATEKNNLREHHREMETDLRSRFTSVATQLSDEKSSIRQAGAYSLAALSNDWDRYGKETGDTLLGNAEHQVCIDILCAYLRNSGRIQEIGEQEVRQTIVELIRKFTLIGDREHLSWIGNTFNLSGANINSVKLNHTDLSGADLSYSDLSEAKLVRANLSNINFSNASLIGTNFTGAILEKSDLSGADLSRAILTETDLSEITWSEDTIWPSDFQPPATARYSGTQT